MPFPFVALFAAIKVACVVCGAAFCTHKLTKAYQKGQETKRLKYEYSLEEKKAAQERNQQAQPKLEEKQKEHENNQTQLQKLEKEAQEARSKSKNSNLSDDERKRWKNKAIALEEEIEKIKSKDKNTLKEIKGLEEKIKKNNQIINSTGLVSDSERGWIWEVLTLENILIMLAIYALYNIVRDERKH